MYNWHYGIHSRKQREKFSRPWIKKQFLKYSNKITGNKRKIDEFDFPKVKNSCASKETIKKLKAGEHFWWLCNVMSCSEYTVITHKVKYRIATGSRNSSPRQSNRKIANKYSNKFV